MAPHLHRSGNTDPLATIYQHLADQQPEVANQLAGALVDRLAPQPRQSPESFSNYALALEARGDTWAAAVADMGPQGWQMAALDYQASNEILSEAIQSHASSQPAPLGTAPRTYRRDPMPYFKLAVAQIHLGTIGRSELSGLTNRLLTLQNQKQYLPFRANSLRMGLWLAAHTPNTELGFRIALRGAMRPDADESRTMSQGCDNAGYKAQSNRIASAYRFVQEFATLSDPSTRAPGSPAWSQKAFAQVVTANIGAPSPFALMSTRALSQQFGTHTSITTVPSLPNPDIFVAHYTRALVSPTTQQ